MENKKNGWSGRREGASSRCANKLRAQNAVAGAVTVFVTSNRFREDLPQYGNAMTHTFRTPTADILEIAGEAEKLLEKIWLPGIRNKKSGVIMTDVRDVSVIQGDLFDRVQNRPERKELMDAIDSINHRYGPKTIKLSVEGGRKGAWMVKHEHRSQNYLTDINDILAIRL